MNEITQKFDHRIKNPDPHIVAILGEIDGIRGEFKSGLRMSPQAITNLKKSTLITSAGASTRIEGAKLNDEEEEKIEDTLSPKQYEVWKYLSEAGEASPGEIIKVTGIVRGTVKQALDRLVELGKIKRVGLGRGTRYIKI